MIILSSIIIITINIKQNNTKIIIVMIINAIALVIMNIKI